MAFLRSTFVAVSVLFLSAISWAGEITIKAGVDLRNGQKDFSVSHFPQSDRYYISMRLHWKNFDPSINSGGYRLDQAGAIQFINPVLPNGCALANGRSFTGFMNGFETGGNLISFVLVGKSCEAYANTLSPQGFALDFQNVPSIANPPTNSPSVHLVVEE